MRFFLATLLWIVSAVAGASETRDPQQFFNDTFGDFQEELENARDEGKKGILLMFEMDECPFCHRMKQTVLNQAEVQDYFSEHFLIFSVDTEGDLEVVDFQGETTTQKDLALKQFRARATPVFQFVDLDGKPARRGRFTGATKDAEEFLAFGRYLATHRYQDTSFTRYKKELEAAP